MPSREQSFIRAAPGPAQPALQALAGLEAALDRLVSEGRTAWPQLSVPEAELLAYVAGRLPASEAAAAAVPHLPAADLHLAFACSQGSEAALAALEAKYRRVLDGAAARASALGVPAEEFLQHFRQKLFVGGRPQIREYSGRGALTSWLKVAATRTALDLAERQRAAQGREVPLDELVLDELPWSLEDPELSHLKEAARAPFRRALEEAVAALSVQDRLLLRQHYVHGLGIDPLAKLLGVHRSNAARALVRARSELLSQVRRSLTRQLKLVGRDVDSLLRLVRSDLPVSLAHLLGSEPEER